MVRYIPLLAKLSASLVRKNIKVVIGMNKYVFLQIDENNNNIDENMIKQLIIDISSSRTHAQLDSNFNPKTSCKGLKVTLLDDTIDSYLIKNRAEVAVVFSDNDAYKEIFNLAKYVDTMWFNSADMPYKKGFNGWTMKIKSANDILKGLKEISQTKTPTRLKPLMEIKEEKTL